MKIPDEPQLYITNIFNKGLPHSEAEDMLCKSISLMDRAALLVDIKLGITPNLENTPAYEIEIEHIDSL